MAVIRKPGAGGEVQRSLTSKNRHERAEAAVQLGKSGKPEAAAELEPLLDDDDDLVAVATIYALWSLGTDRWDGERVAAALGSADEDTVRTAVEAVCEMGQTVVPRLKALLEAGSPHAGAIVRILGDIGGDAARAVLESVAAGKDAALASLAGETLDDLDD